MDLEIALPLLMFVALFAMIMTGFPVAFSIGGTAIAFGLIGHSQDLFILNDFSFIPKKIFGFVGKFTLMAIPLFIFMGIMLEKSGIARELLESSQVILKKVKGGLAISVVLIGALLAASTGIVGATVVTMGALSLPTMLKWGYDKKLATGTIAASGTLGQIIPPSIVLVLLGDMMNVDIGSLFVGAVIPGLILVSSYILYIFVRVSIQPSLTPPQPEGMEPSSGRFSELLQALIPPAFLIIIVLGSILFGFATPTEASGCGALGAIIITFFKKRLSLNILKEVMAATTSMTSMVFAILIGSQFFSVVFRGLYGDEVILDAISDLGLAKTQVLFIILGTMFLLGFFLDFIEICFIIIPIFCPILVDELGFNPLWLAILIAIILQTSFLTPPFGFALFYLKGVAPPEIKTSHIYKGIIPFVLIQVAVMLLLYFFPDLILWLPEKYYA